MKLTRMAFYITVIALLSPRGFGASGGVSGGVSGVTCESLFYRPSSQIAMTGVFPPDHFPTLGELMAPNTKWAKSGKHASILARLYAERISTKHGSRFYAEDFADYGEPVQLTKTILQEALAVLDRYRLQLQEAAERRLAELLQKSSGRSDLKEIDFNEKRYPIFAKLNLPASVEADVYLVESEGQLEVISQFVDSRFQDGYKAEEAFRAHLNFYEAMGRSDFRFARPIEIDFAQKMMRFKFSPGLNSAILKSEVDEKRLPDQVLKSYLLVQAAFANTLIRAMDASAAVRALEKQKYLAFDPHANNTIYDPRTGEWIVVDPY